jgi:hypothetical protein
MKRLKDTYHTGDRVRLVGTTTTGSISGVRHYQGYPECRVDCGLTGSIGWFASEHLEPASPPQATDPDLVARGMVLLAKKAVTP